MQSQFSNFDTPKRFKGRTGLQIFVDRFYREGPPPEQIQGRILKSWSDTTPNWEPDSEGEYQNNYFYGGNLRGIISKLDYIKNNGFNLIYLSPIGLSETSHHYEPTDQLKIDPWIGTWKDFEDLCNEAHSRDILVAVDLVFNHVGIQNPIFQDALQNPNSKYKDWFEWENNLPVFWAGFKNMPQCNKLNAGYQEYACKVSTHYIKMGADAIRLDLGELFPKEFMMKLRSTIKSVNPETLIVSEMWGLDNKRQVPQLDGQQVDSVMNYPLADAIARWVRYGNDSHFTYNVGELLKYPKEAQEVLWNFIDSHDTPRAMNLLVGEGMLEDPYKGAIWDIEAPWRHEGWFDTYGFREWELKHDNIDTKKASGRLNIANTIQYFMPGIPIVFAGTEIGTTGYKDPFNRKPYDWEHPNEAVLSHYQMLGALRKNYREFFSQAGEIKFKISYSRIKIFRKNSFGEMILNIVRDCDDKKSSWKLVVNVKN